MKDPRSVVEILAGPDPGSERSAGTLLPLVYAELRVLAASYLRAERSHTLQPTALVHEAYMKLVGPDKNWNGREHFLAVAARAMRQVLVDHARARNTQKRGKGASRGDVSIEGLGGAVPRELQVLEVNDLLEVLARLAARPARVAEMRLFGGMTTQQIAAVLGVSDFTVKQDWVFARSWLAGKLQEGGRGSK